MPSRSAARAVRNSSSSIAFATRSSIPARKTGNSCAASTQPWGAGGRDRRSSANLSSSYGVIWAPLFAGVPSRRGTPLGSSLECFPQLSEATRDAARNRPGRELEGLPDRLVALVAREEAVEDLLAVLG